MKRELGRLLDLNIRVATAASAAPRPSAHVLLKARHLQCRPCPAVQTVTGYALTPNGKAGHGGDFALTLESPEMVVAISESGVWSPVAIIRSEMKVGEDLWRRSETRT